MYTLFLDETGDHDLRNVNPDYPIFVLSGAIFLNEYYEASAIQAVEELKAKYATYNRSGSALILHSRDIRKQEKGFEFLRVPKIREEFYQDLNGLIQNMDFRILATAILKKNHRDQYAFPASPYDLSLGFIMERFTMFLTDRNASGGIIAESRDDGANRSLYEQYLRIKDRGSGFISPERFRERIKHMGFRTKKSNSPGLQISDLINYPIGSQIACPDHEKVRQAYDIVRPKIHSRGGKMLGIGLKIFPDSGEDFTYLN